MIPIVLAVFLFLLLMAVISVYGYRAYVRPSRIYDRVGGLSETALDLENRLRQAERAWWYASSSRSASRSR